MDGTEENPPPADRDDTIIRLLCEIRSEVMDLRREIVELKELSSDLQRRLRLIAGF